MHRLTRLLCRATLMVSLVFPAAVTHAALAPGEAFHGDWSGELREERLSLRGAGFARCRGRARGERTPATLKLVLELDCPGAFTRDELDLRLQGGNLYDAAGTLVGWLKQNELLYRRQEGARTEVLRVLQEDWSFRVVRATLQGDATGSSSRLLRGDLRSFPVLARQRTTDTAGDLTGLWKGRVSDERLGAEDLSFGEDCGSETRIAATADRLELRYHVLCGGKLRSEDAYEYRIRGTELLDGSGAVAGLLSTEAIEHRRPVPGGLALARLVRDGDRLSLYHGRLGNGNGVLLWTTTGRLQRQP